MDTDTDPVNNPAIMTGSEFASQDTIPGRQMKDLAAEYDYSPAPGPTPTVTSAERVLTDGTSVADLTVTWEVAPGHLLYDVMLTPTGAAARLVADLTTSPLQILDQPTNTIFSVQVRVKHSISNRPGDWGNAVEHTTAGDTGVLNAPANFKLVRSFGTGKLLVQWDPVDVPDYAETVIYRETDSSAQDELRRIVGNAYEDSTATPGTTYYYRARNRDKSNNYSAYSTESSNWASFRGPTAVLSINANDTDPPGSLVVAASGSLAIPAGTVQLALFPLMSPSVGPAVATDVLIQFDLTDGSTTVTSDTNTLNFPSDAGTQPTLQGDLLQSVYAPIPASWWGTTKTLRIYWQDLTGNSQRYNYQANIGTWTESFV